jgi:L-ascorbate oxidase
MRPVSFATLKRGVGYAIPSSLFLAVALTLPQAAVAQSAAASAERIIENPPKLELVRKATRSLLKSTMPRAATPSADEAALDLNVVYTTGKIWNPASQRYDTVKLRSYQGTRVDPKAPFVSPLLEINPGDTIRINLNNKLPSDDTCAKHGDDVNDPHCFNGTNLHTHGLWINPAGNSDNVLISIDPGVSFQYEYNVPSDHPAGTFWYHTHRHGSTALQVSSGMAGSLIIRGKRQPTLDATGDLDVLLKPTPAQPFRERVLMLQQIQYACRDADNNVKYIDPVNKKGYKCDPEDTGGIEGYDIFSRKGWANSGRYTTINGHVLPTFDGASTGQIERWRLTHGGVRDTINLQFRKLKPAARSYASLTAEQQDEFVGDSCTGDPLPQYLVASDGLTAEAAFKSTETIFQPGYRWDILMVFPTDGIYCVIDAAAPAAASVGQAAPSRQLLGVVRVAKGRTVPADIGAYLATELSNAAATNITDSRARSKVQTDLKSGLRLASFVPHPTVQYAELTRDPKTGQPKKQTLVFDMPASGGFLIDDAAFDPKVINRTLTLNDVEEWELSSAAQGHPFHIHVNPFQIVKILDPDGKDVSGPDAVDDYARKFDPTALIDPQYRGMKGMWKDTIWVKNAAVPDAERAIYKVFVRTRYQRYIGDFVLHCHILDHEDQGMMQLVRVALPDGKGGVAKGHHH